MRRLETRLDGPILIEPKVLGDERGFFCETYRRSVFGELGIAEEMVQENHSRSRRGVVRGMHFQVARGACWVGHGSRECAGGDLPPGGRQRPAHQRQRCHENLATRPGF